MSNPIPFGFYKQNLCFWFCSLHAKFITYALQHKGMYFHVIDIPYGTRFFMIFFHFLVQVYSQLVNPDECSSKVCPD